MAEQPGRSTYERADRADPDEEEQGWGSPVPAEYGSLRAVLPRPDEDEVPAPTDRSDESAVSTLIRRLQEDGPVAVVAPAIRRLVPEPFSERSAAPFTPTVDRKGPDAREESEPPVVEPTRLPEPGEPAEPAAVEPPAVEAPAVETPAAELIHARRRRLRPRPNRSRATVRHLDVLSVAKMSAIFWLVMLVAVVVASVLLWLFADAFGSLPSIEKSIRTLFSLKSFKLHPGQVAFYTALAGMVIAVAGIVANVLFALIYNLIADVVGGLRVELDSSPSE